MGDSAGNSAPTAADFHNLALAVAAVGGKVDALHGKVDTCTTSVDDLTAEVTAVKTEVATIKTNLNGDGSPERRGWLGVVVDLKAWKDKQDGGLGVIKAIGQTVVSAVLVAASFQFWGNGPPKGP